MSAEAQLVIEVWEAVRDHLPTGKRGEAASAIVAAMVEYGMEAADLGGIEDEDSDLAEAYRDLFEVSEDDEPEDEL